MIRLLICVTLLMVVASPGFAHEVRPALLDIQRIAKSSVCTIRWKQPSSGEVAVRLVPQLSGGWTGLAPVRDFFGTGQRTIEWRQGNCTAAGLEAQSVTIEGLDAAITDVLVRVDFGDGRLLHRILRPGDPPLRLAAPLTIAQPATAYFPLGVSHILEGTDHLAFVLGLVLLVGLRKRLFVAITGFTLAHSVTLGATALGLLHPWPALIEALVALSIIIVAAEVWRADRGAQSLTIRWPELAALGFGLLHGFAFAGALTEIGLPKGEMLQALLLFNLGVEAGQLLFIGAVLVITLALRPLIARCPQWSRSLPPYAIGSFAGFLFIERTLAVFV